MTGVNEHLLLGLSGSLGVPASYIWQAWFADRAVTTRALTPVTALGFSVAAYAGVRLARLSLRRRVLRLGLDGELATAEELNQLMFRGFRVYHDFPAERFNIDHVVIGPSGVFAVETKTRSKPTTANGERDATVAFDGRYLLFPWGPEEDCLEQAARQAAWLQKWLRQAVGESVLVQAVLALPGWYVERKGRGPILVFNPRETVALFPKVKGARLDEKLITRVAYQVEQRCRNVEPHAYRDAEEPRRRRSFWARTGRVDLARPG
jgi:hypothetical protein